MKGLSLTMFVSVLLATTSAAVAGNGADEDNQLLQGVWVAKSVEIDGKPAPPQVIARMQFTFKDKKLLVRGNYDNDREIEGDYKVDSAQSPKHLDFVLPKESKPIQGIYKLSGDELRVCLRHGGSSEGRPTKFVTKVDSQLILVVFRKQKPQSLLPGK
jgi:uncharacterized protein (TIGR03067 family)